MMKKAFTLIEVNLAMLVMAIGILTVIGLYSFGYRENRQSREDVAATAFADAVVGQLMSALVSTNVYWSDFKELRNYPNNTGWGAYFDRDGIVSQDPEDMAEAAFDSVMSDLKIQSRCPGFNASFPSSAKNNSGMSAGLVVMHQQNSRIVGIGFRATKLPGTLLSMPMYYCEAHFQGDPDK